MGVFMRFTMVWEQIGQPRTSCVIVFLIVEPLLAFPFGSTCGRIFQKVYSGAQIFPVTSGSTVAWHSIAWKFLFYWSTWKMALQLRVWHMFKDDFFLWDSSCVLWRQPLGTLGCISCDVGEVFLTGWPVLSGCSEFCSTQTIIFCCPLSFMESSRVGLKNGWLSTEKAAVVLKMCRCLLLWRPREHRPPRAATSSSYYSLWLRDLPPALLWLPGFPGGGGRAAVLRVCSLLPR